MTPNHIDALPGRPRSPAWQRTRMLMHRQLARRAEDFDSETLWPLIDEQLTLEAPSRRHYPL